MLKDELGNDYPSVVGVTAEVAAGLGVISEMGSWYSFTPDGEGRVIAVSYTEDGDEDKRYLVEYKVSELDA